jgi:hypothetical protein
MITIYTRWAGVFTKSITVRDIRLRTTATLLCLSCATLAYAQQPQPTGAVPKLVRFSGSFRPANGLPAQSAESVTLAVYRDQTGGTVLWSEIQNVAIDADGRYSLLMGATQNEGLPLDLFSSGEPRWLGAQFNRPGEVEQPRVLLVSVPYAMKAADAETLGGRPASAYLLAAPAVGSNTEHESNVGAAVVSTVGATTAPTSIKPKALMPGTQNYIAKFDSNGIATLNSVMYENNGAVGVGTTQPGISLDVRTGALPQIGMAGVTDYLTFFASDQYGPAIYWDPAKDMRFGKGGSGLYNSNGFEEQMRIQSSTGNMGIGTLTPGSKLDVAGDINFSGSIRYQGVPVLQLPVSKYGTINIALGMGALQFNADGFKNAAVGTGALQHNTLGDDNTAIGDSALGSNTWACCNTASGSGALLSNTVGSGNTAAGQGALHSNTTGYGNTAAGVQALASSTSGNNNIGIGNRAAFYVSGGASNNVHIASEGFASDSGTIRIGDPRTQSSFFAAGVRGFTTGNNDAIPVLIDSAGQLGTMNSSRRFKEDIADMGAASHDLMHLRPVIYRYKQAFADGSKPIQYGLIAEEVAEVYPDLVAHSADGQIETVKYQVLDSMLLNEVQRQQAAIQSQQAEIGAQKDQIRRLAEQIVEHGQRNQSLQERLARLEAAMASTSGESKPSVR